MPSPSDGRTKQTDGVCNNRLSIQSRLLPPPSLPPSFRVFRPVAFPSPRVFCPPPPPPLLIETARNRKRRRRSSPAIQIAFFRPVISRTHQAAGDGRRKTRTNAPRCSVLNFLVESSSRVWSKLFNYACLPVNTLPRKLQLRFMQPLNPFVSPALSSSRVSSDRETRIFAANLYDNLDRCRADGLSSRPSAAACSSSTSYVVSRKQMVGNGDGSRDSREDGIDRQWIDPNKKW